MEGPFEIDQDGAVIENFDVTCNEGTEVCVLITADNVTIRNVRMKHHASGIGIYSKLNDGLIIENLEVTSFGNESGPNPCPDGGLTKGYECTNFKGYKLSGVSIKNVRMEGGSSGIQCAFCDNIHIQNFEGINMRGPYPRGQCV